MDGLILVNKPQGLTSHDVVIQLRKILNIQKIGHFGTLDPLATGLIVIGIGKATRFFPYISKVDKLYKGQITLGVSTDTYDSLGEPSSTFKKDWPSKHDILKEMKRFEGKLSQVPPPFSAKKYRGKPIYKLARKKKYLKLKPSKVQIYFFKLKKYHPPLLDFEVKCSSGTYIRSLAHDLGQNLGCGAHLSELKRLEVGTFRLKDAYLLEEIKIKASQDKLKEILVPMESLFPQFPKIILRESGENLAKTGSLVFPENILQIIPENSQPTADKEIVRLFNPEGRLLALAKKNSEKNCLHPFLVLR